MKNFTIRKSKFHNTVITKDLFNSTRKSKFQQKPKKRAINTSQNSRGERPQTHQPKENQNKKEKKLAKFAQTQNNNKIKRSKNGSKNLKTVSMTESNGADSERGDGFGETSDDNLSLSLFVAR